MGLLQKLDLLNPMTRMVSSLLAMGMMKKFVGLYMDLCRSTKQSLLISNSETLELVHGQMILAGQVLLEAWMG